MMIKITEQCGMGCTHCMNNASPNGRHMSLSVMDDVIKFFNTYGGILAILSGGEPSEHPMFEEIICKFMDGIRKDAAVALATNGLWMQDNSKLVEKFENKYGKRLMIQVTSDSRFYPVSIDRNNPVYKHKNVVVVNKVLHIYPQGRAIANQLPHEMPKATKCTNIRLITHQVAVKKLVFIIAMMSTKGFQCTPHITIDGDIKLGESDLCPVCSNIYKSEEEIILDILGFKCYQCGKHLYENLPEQARVILGE